MRTVIKWAARLVLSPLMLLTALFHVSREDPDWGYWLDYWGFRKEAK